MNTKQTEALKLALEGLEKWHFDKDPRGADQYITAIREALADSALERMAENARELGLDYEPPCKTGSQCTSKCQQCEQPAQQQEHVSVMTVLHLKDRTEIGYGPASAGYDLPTGEYRLYTSPPATKPFVGLTDEEVRQAWQSCEMRALNLSEFAAAIEAKLRDKNA